jgi:hypothetical protein
LNYVSEAFTQWRKDNLDLNTFDKEATAVKNDGIMRNKYGDPITDKNGNPMQIQ